MVVSEYSILNRSGNQELLFYGMHSIKMQPFKNVLFNIYTLIWSTLIS